MSHLCESWLKVLAYYKFVNMKLKLSKALVELMKFRLLIIAHVQS